MEQEALRLSELEALKRVRMKQGILDRLPNGCDRLRLPADLLPRDGGNLVEEVGVGFPVFQLLDRHMETGIDTHLIARLQIHADKIARSLENQNLPPHLLLKTKPPIRQCLRHFQDGPIAVIAQNFNHRIGFVDQYLSTDLQLDGLHPWIDRGIILSASHQDPREAFPWHLQQGADTIGRRRELRDYVSDFLEFDFALLLRRLPEDHGMTQLVEDLLSGVAIGE